MAKKVTRVVALKNTWSGGAGEARVAAQLFSFGLHVAKPYWNDDEVDLLVLHGNNNNFLPVPVQVKAVQNDGKNPRVAIQGLKKRYVERQPGLCLAIWSPRWDKIWFIEGRENIRNVYANQAQAHGRGRPRTPYENLKDTNDVRIYVDLSKEGDTAFDKRWLIRHGQPKALTDRIGTLARWLRTKKARIEWYRSLLDSSSVK